MIVDCDVHPTVPGMQALLPYLDDHWREAVARRGIDDQTTISYPTRNPLSFRSDWKNATGKAATTVAKLAGQALDPFSSNFAICNCLYGAQAAFSIVRTGTTTIWRSIADQDDRGAAAGHLPGQCDGCLPGVRMAGPRMLCGG